MIRVSIVHDHRVLRESIIAALRSEPDIEFVEVSSGGGAGPDSFDGKADVLLLGVPWGENPFSQVARYREMFPGTKIVGLYTEEVVRRALLASGADAAVDAADGLEALRAAVRSVIVMPQQSTAEDVGCLTSRFV